MKLQEGRVNLNVEVPNTHRFTIQSSSKAFDILSTLYTDQPMAIARELMCNAYDAQIAAGYKGPAEFHCPTANEPYFYIRDYGTGMTDELIYETYTVMFKSTKLDSNEYTGALGLGAKSPFSIVNNFSVYTYINGTETVWLVYKNDDGIPAISKISERPTKEPNGTKVHLDIPAQHIHKFRTACEYSFMWFSVLPKGNLQINSPNFTLSKPEYSILSNGGPVKALMGNVSYGINLQALNKSFNYDKQTFLDRTGLVLHFNIGDLDFVPSREQLKMNPRTQAQIINKINFVFKDICKKLQEEIDKCENLFLARKLWSSKTTITRLQREPFTFQKINLNNYNMPLPIEVLQSGKKKITYIHYHNLPTIVVNDLKKGAKSRATYKYHQSFYLVSPDNLDKLLEIVGFSKEYAEKNNHLVYASQLPTKPTIQKSRKTAKVSEFKFCNYISDCWATEVDISSVSGYYIEVDRYHGIYGEDTYAVENINKILKFLTEIGHPVKLYGVRKTVSPKHYQHLKPFIPFAKDKFIELCKNTTIEYKGYCNRLRNTSYNTLLPQPIQDLYNKWTITPDGKCLDKYHEIGEILRVTDRPKTIDVAAILNKAIEPYQFIISGTPDIQHIERYIMLVNKGIFK